ncbi:MAG: hypothetical protein JF599_02970 [Verrucomicrobia bacterium]|nr:hypothetical protein [Verrucomicrobiota bacterium]
MSPAAIRAAWRSLSRKARAVVAICGVVAVILFAPQLAEIPQRSALRGSDNTFNYLWLRSLMVGGDWDFRDDLAVCDTLTPEYREASLALPLTPAGRLPNKYGIGWALVSLPFYLVADGVVATGRVLGVWTLARDGYNPVYQISLQTGHFLLAGVALALAYRVIRRWCAREPAVMGVALIWAASPLLYYQTSNLSMSHGVAFFAITLCLYGLVRAEESFDATWPWWLAGMGLGLAVITRFQTAVYGLIPLWVLVDFARKSRDAMAVGRATLGLVAGAAPLIALQLFAWKIVYGSWLVFSYGADGERFAWLHPEVVRVLFSPNHGLFYWHPLLAAGAAGLAILAWHKRGLALAGGVAFVAMIFVNAAWWCWWFGASFGGRAFDGAFLFLMAGWAYLYGRLPARWSRMLFAGSVALAGWNCLLLVLYRLAVIPRNGPVSYEEMAHALPLLFR